MNKIIVFQKKQKKDTIDIWWLSDDGGDSQILKNQTGSFFQNNFLYDALFTY